MAVRMDSTEFVPEFSADGGTTWLTLICPTDWSFSGETPTTETDTLTCGKLTGLGSPGGSCSANAIADKTPAADEVSIEMVQSWWFNKTALKFRAQSPTSGTPGTDLYLAADTRLTSYSFDGSAGDYLKFSISWTLENMDIAP